jgi:hypothetical protein
MQKLLGTVLVVLGLLSLLGLATNGLPSPNLAHFLGTYVPGLAMLLFGMALRIAAIQKAPDYEQESADAMAFRTEARASGLETAGNVGIVVGFATMIFGSGLSRQGADFLLPSITVLHLGWALLIYGSIQYAHWKGYTRWVGLLGYLLLPGLIVLALLPNRRKRWVAQSSPPAQDPQSPFAHERPSFGYRYALALAPLVVLYVGFFGLTVSKRANVAAAEWQDVVEPEFAFRASMPGTLEREHSTQAAPSGNIEIRKFIAKPHGRKELFMIVIVTFPPEALRNIGGDEKLLELGRQDVIAAVEGQIKSEQSISKGGFPGLEVVVLPRKGAVIKSHIYVAGNQFFQVSAHVSQLRLSSTDVQKFFDSFELLLADPGPRKSRS